MNIRTNVRRAMKTARMNRRSYRGDDMGSKGYAGRRLNRALSREID